MGAKHKKAQATNGRQSRRRILLSQKRLKKKHLSDPKTPFFRNFFRACSQIVKNLSLSFRVTFFCFLTVSGAYLYFNRGVPQKIKSELKINDNVTFSLRDMQKNMDPTEVKITPLCGCLLTREHRGVQFFSKTINYEIADTSYQAEDSLHQFTFFSPQDHNGFYPYLEVKAKYYLLKSKDADRVDIDTLLKGGSLRFKYRDIKDSKDSILKEISYDSSAIIMLTTKSNQLKIYTSDSFPIAALLPVKNSKITLSKGHDSYSHENPQFEITESYDTHCSDEERCELPDVDLFGPRTVVVAQGGTLRINDQYYLHDPHDSAYTAIMVFDAAPNLRVSHLKIDSSILKLEVDTPAYNIMYKSTKGLLSLTGETLSDDRFTKLKQLIHTMGAWDDFRKIYHAPQKLGFWGLPAIFNTNGIYVYTHNLSQLHSAETGGNLRYGLKSIPLTGQNQVSIINITNDETYNQPMIFALADEQQNEAQWKFVADGDLVVDDTKIRYNEFDNTFWKNISSILSLITACISLALFYVEVFRSKKQSETSVY
ncbi:MAG: hypothetical protein JO301_14435 [Chitinophagaceae bacterium]|nr:hypothetical protein [Chitinophagaceae bacterium]